MPPPTSPGLEPSSRAPLTPSQPGPRRSHRAGPGHRPTPTARQRRTYRRRGPSAPVRVLIVLTLTAALIGTAALMFTLREQGQPYVPQAGAPAPVTQYPLTVTLDSGPVVIPAQPRRIVSLDPCATAIFRQLGAGPSLVALDPHSAALDPANTLATITLPAGSATDSQAEDYAEAILNQRPDVVILPAAATPTVIERLDRRRVPHLSLLSPAGVQRSLELVQMLGQVSGYSTQAQQVVQQMSTEIDQLREQVSQLNQARGRLLNVYYEQPRGQSIETIFPMITTWVPLTPTPPDYPYLNSQGEAFEGHYASAAASLRPTPDLIVLATGQSSEQALARPGWSGVAALRDPQRVVHIDPLQISVQGPQQVQVLRTIVQAAARLPVTR